MHKFLSSILIQYNLCFSFTGGKPFHFIFTTGSGNDNNLVYRIERLHLCRHLHIYILIMPRLVNLIFFCHLHRLHPAPYYNDSILQCIAAGVSGLSSCPCCAPFYTLWPLKTVKKEGVSDPTKYINSCSGSLTESIEPCLSDHPSVCLRQQISAIIQSRDTKFGMQVSVQMPQHRPRNSVI